MLFSPALYLLLGALWSNHSLTMAQSDQPVVDTGYAQYLGNRTRENTVAYLGIPYAERPVGDLRFRTPLPLNTTRVSQEAGGQVVDATEYPDFCIQGSIGQGDAGGAGSEDCLKVNIYAPSDASSDSNLPVLVYFHGGGYRYGNPRNWPFDHWIEQSPNVVAVSVYYRLDSLGFLATPEFTNSSLGDFNVGFKDQIQALKWMKGNIASFGGDASKVTISGQSAGGGSVLLHLVAKEDEQLFSAGIGQSVYRPTMPTPEQMTPLFEHYVEQAGCAGGSIADQMACLRSADVSALTRAQDSDFDSDYTAFHPVLDGQLITAYPTESILAGDFVDVPLIVGATSNETETGGATVGLAIQAMYPQVTDSDADEFNQVYSSSDIPEDLQVTVASGESVFRCARHIMATAASNSWTYRYNQPNPTTGRDIVEHAAENWMMFEGINTSINGTGEFTPMTEIEQAFASELIAYWLSFVRSNDPNTFKLETSPVWISYKEDKARIVLQEDPDGNPDVSGSVMENENDEESTRCEFVGSMTEQEQN